MSKKTKTTSDQSTHQVTTPNNPAWVDNGLASLGGQISGLSKLDPYSLVATADPLQSQAATTASGLGTPTQYGQAQDIFGKVAKAGANGYTPSTGVSSSLLDGLQNYMSPYTNDVVNTTLAGFDQNAGHTRAQQTLDLAGDSTFGGSGGALTRSMTERNLAQTRAATEAQLRDQAFTTGAGLSNSDAGRRQDMSLANMGALNSAGQFNASEQDQALQRQLAAGGAMADTATAQDANTRSNAGTQASIGDMLRQIQAAKQMAPISLLSTQAGLMSALPLGMVHGQTEDGTSHGTSTQTVSDPMGSIGSLAMGMGALLGAPLTGGLSLGALGGLGGAAAAAAPTVGGSLMSMFKGGK